MNEVQWTEEELAVKGYAEWLGLKLVKVSGLIGLRCLKVGDGSSFLSRPTAERGEDVRDAELLTPHEASQALEAFEADLQADHVADAADADEVAAVRAAIAADEERKRSLFPMPLTTAKPILKVISNPAKGKPPTCN